MTLWYVVTCDYPGCSESVRLSAGDITAALNRVGWTVRPDAIEHVCPEHTRGV